MTSQKRSEPGTIPLVRFFHFRCQTFVLSKIKRSWSSRCKQNKHRPRVAKARAFKKILSKSRGEGSPGFGGKRARARVHSRAFIKTNVFLRGSPRLSEPLTGSGKGRKRVPGRCGGKMRKCEPAHTAFGGMSNWEFCGRVRANKITLSGAGHCRGRGRTGGTPSGRECARIRVPGNSVRVQLRRIFHVCTVRTAAPIIGPVSCHARYPSHVLVPFLQK